MNLVCALNLGQAPQMQLNKPFLLTFLAVLVAIKFLFVPWYQYQDEQIATLEVNSKKLGRALALQGQQQQLEQEVEKLSSAVASYENLLPSGADKNAVSLAVQSQWQQVFEQHQVEVKLFNWAGERQLEQSDYWQARVVLKLSAPLERTLQALAELEQKYPLSFEESLLNDVTGIQFRQHQELQLTVDLLFKVEAS